MTERKHLKRRVRDRMSRTGESYASARRHVTGDRGPAPEPFVHLPGTVPAATALRILLANAGILDPRTGAPFSEAMVFGIGGGIGMGIFAFRYEAEDVSTFFVAGRHLWHDDQAWLERAVTRFAATPTILESGAAGKALTDLNLALSLSPAVIAWVDMAHLPWRAMPASWSGGGYHVVTIYDLEPGRESARVGDLTPVPYTISLSDLALARGRIRKQRHRLLSLEPSGAPFDLHSAVMAGLRACHETLRTNRRRNFTLDALADWADRIQGSRRKDSWDLVFRRGRPLLQGLGSVYDFVEHHGTGGGLARPMFAAFLKEAGNALGLPALLALASEYATLGGKWAALATAALPDSVPVLSEYRRAVDRRARLTRSAAPSEEIRAAWQDLATHSDRIGMDFPLDEHQADDLREDLKARVQELHAGEVRAHRNLAALAG